MSVADVIRPSGEDVDESQKPNCVTIEKVSVCEEMPVDPEWAALSFGPYVYFNLLLVNLLFFLYILPVHFNKIKVNRTNYTYWWVWISALSAVDVPLLIPALTYPFIFGEGKKVKGIFYSSMLFATSGPFVGYFMPVALIMSSYYEGLTSGIWIDPNN